jgi:DNA polymerase-3 subunit alpha
MPEFVHLHTHSSHSVRDSIARPDDLFAAAASDGQSAMAITDHGNMSGLYVAHKAAKSRGVNLIAGIEAYMAITSRSPNRSSVTTARRPPTTSGARRSTPTSRCWPSRPRVSRI